MQLRIRHTTRYTYEDEASASYSEARLTPLTTLDQFVRRSRVEISPTAWTAEYRDYWGTTVTAFEVTEPHSEMVVTATSVVDTADTLADGDSIDWKVLAVPSVRDEYCEFLAMRPFVQPHVELVELAKDLRGRAASPAHFVREITGIVNDQIDLLVAATHVSDTAEEVWIAGSGVPHDLTHVAIGALRSVGIPARFVGGYVHPQAVPEIADPQSAEPHAWLEWWDGSWVGWDVARSEMPGEAHVAVAVGRDFSDNPPLRGVYAAEGPAVTDVSVQVTRLV